MKKVDKMLRQFILEILREVWVGIREGMASRDKIEHKKGERDVESRIDNC